MATLPQLMANLLPFFMYVFFHFNYPFFLVGWDWSIYSIYSSTMGFELIHFCSAPFTGMGLDICQFVLPARPSRTAARAGFGSMFADPEPMIRIWVYVCRSVLTFIDHLTRAGFWPSRIDFVQIGLGNMCNDYDIKCVDFSWSTTIGLPNGSRNAYFQTTRFPNGSQEWIVNPNGC